ncbi:MAG: YfhO family protein [Lachnospiraceae bacterium]|nr:YfhO family protein [Lachnospiraceae bacterium]
MRTENPIRHLKMVFIYTIVFCVVFFAMFFLFIVNGKTLIRDDDILRGFENIPSIIRTLKNGGIQAFDYNLSSDITFFSYSNALLYFVLSDYLETAYFLLQVFRLWGAGLTFFLFTYVGKKIEPEWALFGSILYISSGFSVISELRQPGFIAMLIWYPIMIWGVDNKLADKNTILIVLATACIFLHSPYCGWYLVVATGIYIISHIFFLYTGVLRVIKTLFLIFLDILIGIGIAAFQFLPTLMAAFGSRRLYTEPAAATQTEVSLLSVFTYGKDGWINMIKYFFIWQPKYKYIASFGYFGISALLLVPLLFYCFNKEKEGRENRLFLLLVILLMQFPLFGRLAGISNSTNRWSFCLGFVVSYIAVLSVPKLLCLSIKDLRHIILGSVFVFLTYCIIAVITTDKYILAECMMLLFGMIVFLGLIVAGQKYHPFLSKKKLMYIALFSAQGIVIAINGLMLETDSFCSHYLKWGETKSVFQACPDYAYEMIEDDTDFYRIEKESNAPDISCNLPRWYGYNGISSYDSLLYPDVMDYYYMSGNPGVKGCNSIMDLDGRISDELLAGVKFFLSSTDNTKIPYGFEEYKSSDKYNVYINRNSLPFAYSYEKSIGTGEYTGLNIAQQQEMLLKRVVLHDDRVSPNENDIYTDGLKSRELQYRTISCESVTKDNVWKFGESGIVTIQTEVPKNCELYVVLDGIDKSPGKNTVFHLTIDGYCQDFRSDEVESVYGNHQSFVCINLGKGYDGLKNINIGSEKCISVDGIKLFARDLSEVVTDVQHLKDNTMDDIEFNTNTVTGDFYSQKEKWLCFSIPYSEGWSCKVDGVAAPLVKANIMYMAVNLPAGEHHIELNYYPVGRKPGWVISIISLSFIIAFELLIRRKCKIHD